MDFDSAILAHVNWRARLLRAINGKSNETLDPAVIESDGCPLGQWLRAEGKVLSADPGYAELVRMHAEFHRAAATVVRQVQGGRAEEARATLKQDVDRLSLRVVGKLGLFKRAHA
jgi:hypothetical protein